MKGVHFVVNDKGERVAVQIDLNVLSRQYGAVVDALDVALAAHRDEDASWEDAKRELKKN